MEPAKWLKDCCDVIHIPSVSQDSCSNILQNEPEKVNKNI